MNVLFLALAIPFIIYLTFIRPFQTERISRGTVKHPNPKFRFLFYQRSIRFKVLTSLYVIAAMLVSGQPLIKLFSPLGPVPLIPQGFWFTLLILIFEILILTELLNRFAGIRHFLLIGDVNAILPRTSRERLLWIPTAIAAGVGEELVYRSFMIYFFMHLPIHLSAVQALIASSILFGFSHLYQGWLGVTGTALAGLILGNLFLSYGFLPVAIIHSVIDLRVALLSTPRRRTRKLSAAGV